MPFPNVMPPGAPPVDTLPLEQSADATTRDPELKQEFDDLKQKLVSLQALWNVEASETERRRKLRFLKVNNEERRKQGLQKKDEIFIPVRVANDNITKEAAQFVSYLTSSRNTVVFKPKTPVQDATGTELPTEKLEQWFTKQCRYAGWELPHLRVIDGSQSHGWDSVEVVFDETKPGHFAIEHIMHERLWFPEDTEDIQDSPLLVRVYHLPKDKMRKMFPDASSKEQIDKIFYDRDAKTQANVSLQVLYKVYYRRDDGVVYTCYMNHEKCDWFVREPMPLFRGRSKQFQDIQGNVTETPIYETRYPIHTLPYMTLEDNRLLKTLGRVALDEYTQEAASSLISTIVNGYYRATQPMGSPRNPNSLGNSSIKVLENVTIESGRLYDTPIDFFNLPYPDPAGLQLVNSLITQNKQEAGQTSFATLNRDQPGDRKTAKEISTSSSQESLLSTVKLILLSLFQKDVYTDCWSITASRLECQKLTEAGEIDLTYLQTEYDIFAAGDTEVVQRDETVQKLMQLWPIISQTPAAMKVLTDLLTLIVPARAQSYIEAMNAGDPKSVLVQELANVLMTIAQQHPEVIPPGSEQQLAGLLQQAKAVSQQPSAGPVGGTAAPVGINTAQAPPVGAPVGNAPQTQTQTAPQPQPQAA